jgi:hypothetical protein
MIAEVEKGGKYKNNLRGNVIEEEHPETNSMLENHVDQENNENKGLKCKFIKF